MDRRVSEQSPTKYRSVLLEMRRNARPGLDMLYLSGFAETLAVIERQNAQAPGRHDLTVSDVACVLRAWGDFENDAWAGGFVLELTNGRRVYVESYADGPDWGSDCRVSVRTCRWKAPCRSFRQTTTPSCMAGSRTSPSSVTI